MHSQIVGLLLAMTLLVSFSACATPKGEIPVDPNESKPTIFVAVSDTSCPGVEKRIKFNLESDPELGLALEEPIEHGMAYELPILHKGDLRYSGTVRVICDDPKTTRVSVGLDMRRKNDEGDWVKVNETSKMERWILDKVLKPERLR